MTEVTRNVIVDLLPLYLSGEASEDTAALVKNYLDNDPELAELASQMSKAESLNEAPAPRSKEIEMEEFEKTKQMLVIRSAIVFTAVAMFLCTAFLVIPLLIHFLK